MEKNQNRKGKKKRMVILFSALGVLVIFITAVVITGLHASRPTKGNAIARYGNPKSALLVMDMQNDITNDKAYGNTAGFVDSVNQAIAYAEENGMEILYVKNVYGNNPIVLLLAGGKGKKGTVGVEFDNRLNVVNSNVFTKSIGDAFSSAEFEKYLIAKQVDTLYIVGADAAGCVLNTALGGRNRGYSATVIRDAVTTRVNDAKMKQVEAQYKKGGIQTITLNELRR